MITVMRAAILSWCSFSRHALCLLYVSRSHTSLRKTARAMNNLHSCGRGWFDCMCGCFQSPAEKMENTNVLLSLSARVVSESRMSFFRDKWQLMNRIRYRVWHKNTA